MTQSEDRAPVNDAGARVPRPQVINTGYPGALAIVAGALLLPGAASLFVGGWLLGLALVSAGLVVLRASFRSRREQREYFDDVERQELLARNVCPNCRYDRTGLAAEAVCPECGAGLG